MLRIADPGPTAAAISSGLCWLVLGGLLVAGLAGCSVEADGTQSSTLTVFAASSLTDAFEELGTEFEERNPGTEVRFNFAGSSVLLAQLQRGATVDVFASADEDKMQAAVDEGLVVDPRLFSKNRPVIIVPENNPAGVESVRDLGDRRVELVLAQDGVPIAEYAEKVLQNADMRYAEDFSPRVHENLVSRESNVRAAASKVVLGEADATFVYASDVTPDMRDEVEVIEIPPEINTAATYLIAVVEEATNPELALEWQEFVLSEAGQRVLEKWGFRRTA